jgi:hypothetical protein
MAKTNANKTEARMAPAATVTVADVFRELRALMTAQQTARAQEAARTRRAEIERVQEGVSRNNETWRRLRSDAGPRWRPSRRRASASSSRAWIRKAIMPTLAAWQPFALGRTARRKNVFANTTTPSAMAIGSGRS